MNYYINMYTTRKTFYSTVNVTSTFILKLIRKNCKTSDENLRKR